MKTAVVVSRKWDSPAIYAYMTTDEVGASMSVEDALRSMIEEMGSPTFVMTKATLLKKMLESWEVVAKEIKEATRHV